ncbi:MAG: hypothetical protein LBH84_04730 [Prevotellaceae bacterium]|jgi:hypothetical protein|nr:hypothetical protein [Prevotellaceae bacterium]
MEEKKAPEAAKPAAPAKSKGRKGELVGWYMDERGVRIPLDEYFKNEPPRTGPSRFEMLKKQGYFPNMSMEEIRAM